MIRWNGGDGKVWDGSLFAVFAALSRSDVVSFPALRPHQREPWHAFCAQVAAMALIAAGRSDLPEDEAGWRDLLIGLTPDWPDGEAWDLVVDDWRKPALLQPPLVAPANRDDYKSRLTTPDALDMLVTAKNHDVKQERMVAARDEDWLFALVTLQTSAAYGGAKTYGASRMNGKTGSRLSVRVVPEGGAGRAFRRDAALLFKQYAPEAPEGIGLVWTRAWDGKVPLGFGELNPPLYIDTARRVRVVRSENALHACYATAEKARVAAEEQCGKTSDPWAPIKKDLTASITPKRETFGYRKLSDLLTSRLPLLGKVHSSDDQTGLALEITALVRRGGTDTNTEGWFQRRIGVSRRTSIRLGAEAFTDRLGITAERRAKDAGDARGRLRHAMLSLVQGGPAQPKLDDDSGGRKIEPWTQRFDLAVDRVFFNDAFWGEVADEAAPHTLDWRERLRDMARTVFDEAAEAAPRTEVRRIRAHARAKNLLEAQLHRFVEDARDA